MLTKFEKLGDRLLSMVVPHAHASAAGCKCVCYRIGVCSRTTDKWQCSATWPCTAPSKIRCAYTNPCNL
jgi:hypothetical protein